MRIAGAPDGTHLDAHSAAPGTEYRCPTCGGGLVLRCGRRTAPHFAHRPRQACSRPGVPSRRGTGRLFTQLELPFDAPPARPARPVRIRRRPKAVSPTTARPWWRRLWAWRPG